MKNNVLKMKNNEHAESIDNIIFQVIELENEIKIKTDQLNDLKTYLKKVKPEHPALCFYTQERMKIIGTNNDLENAFAREEALFTLLFKKNYTISDSKALKEYLSQNPRLESLFHIDVINCLKIKQGK